jgi:hypothetical protein
MKLLIRQCSIYSSEHFAKKHTVFATDFNKRALKSSDVTSPKS